MVEGWKNYFAKKREIVENEFKEEENRRGGAGNKHWYLPHAQSGGA